MIYRLANLEIGIAMCTDIDFCPYTGYQDKHWLRKRRRKEERKMGEQQRRPFYGPFLCIPFAFATALYRNAIFFSLLFFTHGDYKSMLTNMDFFSNYWKAKMMICMFVNGKSPWTKGSLFVQQKKNILGSAYRRDHGLFEWNNSKHFPA